MIWYTFYMTSPGGRCTYMRESNCEMPEYTIFLANAPCATTYEAETLVAMLENAFYQGRQAQRIQDGK